MKLISLADEELCNVRQRKRFQGQLRSATFMQFWIIFASCFLLWFKLQFLNTSKLPCLFSSLTSLVNRTVNVYQRNIFKDSVSTLDDLYFQRVGFFFSEVDGSRVCPTE